mgnify:FL=1
MAENNSGDNRQSDFPKNSRRPNVPSGGFQGWLVVALIIALVSIYFLSKTRVLKTIEPLQFEQMVLHKEIAKLTIIKNKDIDRKSVV